MRTRTARTVVVTPTFRRIRVTKDTTPKDVQQFLGKNRQKIVRGIDEKLRNPFTSQKRKDQLRKLKQLVSTADKPQKWKAAVTYAAGIGLLSLQTVGVIQEMLIRDGMAETPAFVTAAAVSLTGSSIVIPHLLKAANPPEAKR